MEFILTYGQELSVMSPSIAISVVYLILILCAHIFNDLSNAGQFEKMMTIIFFCLAIFAISLSIGRVIQNELPSVMVIDDLYGITLHEEFLIALMVEMLGAALFVPFIYGTSDSSPRIRRSFQISIILLIILFVLPLRLLLTALFSVNPGLIANYVDNMRTELLSIIVIFILYSFWRILPMKDRQARVRIARQLGMMTLAIVIAFVLIQILAINDTYEDVSLALIAAMISAFIIALARLNDLALYGIILFTIVMSITLLTGTQLESFSIAPSTAINLTAEFIGGITVALILDG